jgi:hypothetical protein
VHRITGLAAKTLAAKDLAAKDLAAKDLAAKDLAAEDLAAKLARFVNSSWQYYLMSGANTDSA